MTSPVLDEAARIDLEFDARFVFSEAWMFEQLEQRLLLSTLKSGVLRIVGTNRSETINVSQRKANIIVQMQNLRMHPAVDEAIRQGSLRLHGWMYDIGSGDIRRFDPELGAFCGLLADSTDSVEEQQKLKIA